MMELRARRRVGFDLRRPAVADGVGDKVMQIENNYDRDVYNGDIGYVTDIDADDEEVA